MQPIDYTQGFRPVNIADQLGTGFQVGSGIRNELQRRQDEAIARQQAEQEQIKAMRRAAEYERDVFSVFNDPTPQNIAKLQITYPERIKQFQDGFETLDKARVADERRFVGELYASARSNPDVAKQLLTNRITALESANQDVTEEKTALELLKTDPKQALGYIGSLAAFTLPKDQIDALAKLDEGARAEAMAPSALAKSEAEAAKAATEAQQAPLRFQFDMAKVQEDIRASRENTRIRALEASIKREENAGKREELQVKRDEAIRAFQEKAAGKAADLDVGLSSISDAREIVTELLANPDAVRSATGGLAIRSAVPGSEARDVATKIERLQNTLAASNLDKLKGAMSDKDLLFLTNISSSLDRSQSEASFLRELERISKTLDRSEKQVLTRFGAAKSTAPESAAPDIDALLRKYGAQ